jgi:glycosyltransferase involved in cell wall biosynthesis
MKSLSLVIPCFNEAQNLPLLIKRCSEVVSNNQIEVIIVDNGSTDDTDLVLNSLAPQYPFLVRVKVKKNKGYGNGIISGLKKSSGQILGWTHADMQTDPADVLKGLEFFKNSDNPQNIFVKGKRYGRPLLDTFFTIGMSLFETVLLRKAMWDINSQPTLFHRDFFLSWLSPPNDFSLDLYAYFLAKKTNLKVKRFRVYFGKRAHGVSHWNISIAGKIKFIKRTLNYSFNLRKMLKKKNA